MKGEGKGWRGNSEGHAIAGRKTSEDRVHMSDIGSRGGKIVSADRSHMAALGRIGRKGGGAKRKAKPAV